MLDLNHALETAAKLALKAGAYSKEKWGTVEIDWKNADQSGLAGARAYASQAVTPVDVASQKIILEGLIEEGYNKATGVRAEEETEELKQFIDNPDLRWVIDPLDGTFNYATANEKTRRECEKKFGIKLESDHRIYGVSIGLQENQQDFLIGVIYLPFLKELYLAKKGFGATKNGEKLQIPQIEFKEDIEIHSNTKGEFIKPIFKNYKLPWCIVYSLTKIADGKNNAFFAKSTNLHDVGPSSLIVAEAGGYVSDQYGNPLDYNAKDEKGRIPYYVAGPNKKFNLAVLKKIRDSGFDFKV